MFLKWAQSIQGKRVFGGLMVVVSASAGFAQVQLHTYFLHKYLGFMQMYRSGFEVPVPKELNELADKVFVDSNLRERDVDAMKLFTVVGLDAFSAGSTKLRTGAIIGIPYNLRYEREADVETSELKLKTSSKEASNCGEFDRDSQQGQVMIRSLVLSEAAKRFVIAREIHSCTTYRNIIACVGTTTTLLFGYILGTYLNNKYRFETRLSLPVRTAAYTVCGAISVVMCFMVNDAVHLFYDARADAAAARLGRDYATGGVEYYEKQVERNKALHKVLGDEGDKYYTAGGNFNSLLRTTSLPPVARLDNLRLHLKKYTDNDEQIA